MHFLHRLTKDMKILLLTNHLNPGGIATYTISLAKGLSKRGHLVKVASRCGEWRGQLEDSGIGHIYLNLQTKSEVSPLLISAKKKLLDILKDGGTDILHPQTRISRVLAQSVFKRTGIPFVSTAHGFYKKRLGSRLFPCWGAGVVAVSEAVKKDIISKFNLAPEKIKVIHNGINLDRFSEIMSGSDKEKIKESLGLGGKRIILNVSRLSFIKGHTYLVKVARIIIQNYADVDCVIIGEGEAETSLKEEIKGLGIERRIRLLRSVGDRFEFLSIADVFVLPSLQEGLGLSILEAMAAGIPVVATDIGGIPEIIRNGENGILVPPRDIPALSKAVCRVLEDDALRDRLVQNGRRTVEERFSLDRMVNQTEEFYRRIIDKHLRAER